MSGDDLNVARAREATLRARLAEAIAERARAANEAGRLEGRSQLTGADPAIGVAAAEQDRLASVAAASVETLRAQLRRAEGVVASLEARADAERAARRDPQDG